MHEIHKYHIMTSDFKLNGYIPKCTKETHTLPYCTLKHKQINLQRWLKEEAGETFQRNIKRKPSKTITHINFL